MIVASWVVPLLSVSLSWRGSIRLMGMFGVFSAMLCFYFLKDRNKETVGN